MHLYKTAVMGALAQAVLAAGTYTSERPPMSDDWSDAPSPMSVEARRAAKKRKANAHKFRGNKRRAFDHG
jgi:hypothetical protein